MNVALWFWSINISKHDFFDVFFVTRRLAVVVAAVFFAPGRLFRFSLCTWCCNARIRSFNFSISPVWCVRCWIKCCFSPIQRSKFVFRRSCSKTKHVRSVSNSYNFLSNSSISRCCSSLDLFVATGFIWCCSPRLLRNWSSFLSSPLTMVCSLISTSCRSIFSCKLKLNEGKRNEVEQRRTSHWPIDRFLVAVCRFRPARCRHLPVEVISIYFPPVVVVDLDKRNKLFAISSLLDERHCRSATFVAPVPRRCTIEIDLWAFGTVSANVSISTNVCRERVSTCWSVRRVVRVISDSSPTVRSMCESSLPTSRIQTAAMTFGLESEVKRRVSVAKMNAMIWTNGVNEWLKSTMIDVLRRWGHSAKIIVTALPSILLRQSTLRRTITMYDEREKNFTVTTYRAQCVANASKRRFQLFDFLLPITKCLKNNREENLQLSLRQTITGQCFSCLW